MSRIVVALGGNALIRRGEEASTVSIAGTAWVRVRRPAEVTAASDRR